MDFSDRSGDCLTDQEACEIAGGATSEALANREVHLDGCAACRELVAHLTRVSGGGGPGELPAAATVLLGRFEIGPAVGAGGMGVVFQARDRTLDRRVALKFVRVSGEIDPQAARERLVRESRALARLNHPNVVTLYDVGEHGDEIYLAMELVEGTTFDDWLSLAPRTYREVLDAFAQACRGVEAAHAAGLVHRDIKPSNIFVGDDGRVRVGDFGLVRESGPAEGGGEGLDRADDGRLTRGLLGTPRYMAPEQLVGGETTTRSDQWSLAATLWEALFARPDDLAIGGLRVDATDPAPVAARDGRRIPRHVRSALRRALDPDPARRWPSVSELRTALLARSRRLAWTATALVAVAGLGLLVGRLAAAPGQGSDPCDGIDRALTGVWDAARRSALEQAFGSTGASYAPDLARTVERAIDRYARASLVLRRDVCEGVRERGVTANQAALQFACLDEQRAALDASVAQLSRMDATGLPRALEAIRGLPDPDACADLDALANRQALPREPGARREVERLSAELDRGWAEFRAREDPAALPLASRIADRAAALRFAPLRARALQLAAYVRYQQFDPAVVDTLRQAILAAEEAGDGLLQAELTVSLYGAAVLGALPEPEAVRTFELAEAKLVALEQRAPRSAGRLRWFLLGNRGNYQIRDDPDGAAQTLDGSVKNADRIFGRDSVESIEARRSLVNALIRGAHYERALEVMKPLVSDSERVLGAFHPDMSAVHMLAAAANHFVGHEEEALAQIDAATRLIGDRPAAELRAALLELEADVLMTTGRMQDGAQRLERALALVEGAPAARTDPVRARLACAWRALERGREPSLAELEAAEPGSRRTGKRRLEVAGCFLDVLRSQVAVPLLEPAALAGLGGEEILRIETRAVYAQALYQRGRDPARARAEGERARRECVAVGSARALHIARQLDEWLADVP